MDSPLYSMDVLFQLLTCHQYVLVPQHLTQTLLIGQHLSWHGLNREKEITFWEGKNEKITKVKVMGKAKMEPSNKSNGNSKSY